MSILPESNVCTTCRATRGSTTDRLATGSRTSVALLEFGLRISVEFAGPCTFIMKLETSILSP
jgi:hypothetical protein